MTGLDSKRVHYVFQARNAFAKGAGSGLDQMGSGK
jgi:hypothetical protein